MLSKIKHEHRYAIDRSLGIILNSSMILTVVFIIGYVYVRLK